MTYPLSPTERTQQGYCYHDGTPYATECRFCGKPLPHHRTICIDCMTDADRHMADGTYMEAVRGFQHFDPEEVLA